MRVISGSARGKNLQTLEGLETRPTIDRVKEGIFSSIQFNIPGARVLDLFAGSGQMGIECLSRDAAFCIFVDSNADAVEIVKQNAKSCGLFEKARIVNMTAESFLRTTREKFDIVFLDPPYNYGTLDDVIPKVYELLSPYGIIIAESESGWELNNPIPDLTLKKVYKYGKVQVTKFIKEENI